VTNGRPRDAALVLAGGLALGAYQAGAIKVLAGSPLLDIRAISGTSIGAVTGAILAGNPRESWAEKLDAFWRAVANDNGWFGASGFGWAGMPLQARHAHNWASSMRTRLTGTPGLFRPSLPGERDATEPCPSLYRHEPARNLLASLVDFGRLNDGTIRLCVTACDMRAGEMVIFDTRAQRVALDHILASGSLLPAFSPTEVDGRMLADGGFAANAPLEPFLSTNRIEADWPIVILLDLFAAEIDPPASSLEASVAIGTDLQFAMQTRMQLRHLARERALEAGCGDARPGVDLFHLSYRALDHDAGPEKTYDFSSATLGDRMREGQHDALLLLERLALCDSAGDSNMRLHRIRRARHGSNAGETRS
jgi:NTE family protein